MNNSELKLIDPTRGQKVFLKRMGQPAKSTFCTYLFTLKELIFHYLRWIDDRLEMENPSPGERERLLAVRVSLMPAYKALLPTSAEKRWAQKWHLHFNPIPTEESVSDALNTLVVALEGIEDDERKDLFAILTSIWRCARDGADDPAWLIEFTGSELIELNYYHRLAVLVWKRMMGLLDDREWAAAAFSYAQRPLSRDFFYHTDNSVECFRRAIGKLSFRAAETALLIFRDFFDHLEAFSESKRATFRADAKKNLSPEDFAYVMSTLENLKIIVDEAREAHPGTAKKRFDELRLVVNFEASLNALRKRAIYGHSFTYAFPLLSPVQVLYLTAGKIGVAEDSIFFDFSRLILNPHLDRVAHLRNVNRPFFAGIVHLDPMTLN